MSWTAARNQLTRSCANQARTRRIGINRRFNGAVCYQKNAHSTEDMVAEAYRQAFTMSQLYVANRPEPIPVSEHHKRWKERDVLEITQAGKKAGKDAGAVRSGLERLEGLLPGVVSLDKMRASDWAAVALDLNSAVQKIIQLKTLYPKADLTKLVGNRPKVLLQSIAEIQENAVQVKAMLATSKDADAIIEAVPDLADPAALAAALSSLRSWFRNHSDPVEVLDRDPTFLLRTGQSVIEPDEEYGIIAFF